MSLSRFQEEMLKGEEVEHVAPLMECGTYLGSSADEEIYFQSCNTDTNFAELGVVNTLKLKHRSYWSFKSGE